VLRDRARGWSRTRAAQCRLRTQDIVVARSGAPNVAYFSSGVHRDVRISEEIQSPHD
jgi:hypothetical protein